MRNDFETLEMKTESWSPESLTIKEAGQEFSSYAYLYMLSTGHSCPLGVNVNQNWTMFCRHILISVHFGSADISACKICLNWF